MQDIEFTIERGKLYILQTRNGKRTATAALRIAVEMVREKLISKDEAILRVNPAQIDQLLHPTLDPAAAKTVVAKGLPASPGAATGQVVFDSETAEKWVNEMNRKVILVRLETSPEDIGGMSVSQGILTARGGMTSHAAVVARGMGKCCVSGCAAIKVSHERREFHVGSRIFKEGDFVTLDGSTGEVIEGKIATIIPTLNKNFQELMKWVDDARTIGVRTNADTPLDSKIARGFGAEGIGLCRTEHMFFEADRIDAVREMILADTPTGRERALEKILPMQRSDFKGIFREMKGWPVTIRLLDPPLHEFIPHTDDELHSLARKIDISFERLKRKAESLHEFNPMLGHRGCRLGVSYPEIYRTQVRASCEKRDRDRGRCSGGRRFWRERAGCSDHARSRRSLKTGGGTRWPGGDGGGAVGARRPRADLHRRGKPQLWIWSGPWARRDAVGRRRLAGGRRCRHSPGLGGAGGRNRLADLPRGCGPAGKGDRVAGSDGGDTGAQAAR